MDLKVPLDEKRGDGYTPLSLSIMSSKNTDIAKILLQAGADVDLVSKVGVSPLFFAIKTQNKEAIKLLLDHGAKCVYGSAKKVDRSPIFSAVYDES